MGAWQNHRARQAGKYAKRQALAMERLAAQAPVYQPPPMAGPVYHDPAQTQAAYRNGWTDGTRAGWESGWWDGQRALAEGLRDGLISLDEALANLGCYVPAPPAPLPPGVHPEGMPRA